LLVTLLSPILYFFVFRQSKSYITELSKASEILQTQFQENQRARERLELERNKLRNILDSMNDGVYIVNQHYDIGYSNPATERDFGPINGRKCYEYLHDRREICPWCNNAVVFSGKSVQWEWYFAKAGKTYDLIGSPYINEDGTVSKLEIFHDITERKRAEEAVQKSEEKYRLLVETMNEGLGVKDENGLWTYANDKLCYMLGYFQGELIGRPVAESFDERNQKIYKEQMALRKKGKAGSYEISWTNKDGQKIPTIVSPKPIFDKDGHYKGSFAIITDITERKHAEEVLRHLSAELLTIQEQERKRISGELHDELGQALAVLKIQQAFVEKPAEDQVELKEQCKQYVTYVDQIIENVRRLSRDLSPYALEYLGLTTALKRLIIDFMKNYNIEVAFDVMDADPLFTKENQIIIYRIVQEALNNIRKHAQTAKASVAIRQNDNRVSFSIEDDGKGFDVEEMLVRAPAKKGLGLTIIEERIRMLGGALDLWSEEGKGTRISFSIPIEKGPE
jgi:PAS domain S-box-containing protein